jgi:hypothetical protein
VVAMLTWNQSSRAGQAAPVNKVGVVHTSPCLLGTRQALAWATVVQEHVFRPSSSIHLPTGGVSVEQERVVWGRPRAIQFRREFPFVRRIHLVGLRIARWHRSSEPPLPSSPLPWPLPMGAITTLCIVNLERAVAFPTSHMVCVETAPKCIVHRQHASSMLAVYHPPGLQGRPMDGHTVDAQRHPYLSCGRSPPHMYVSIVPVASSSRITPNATHSSPHHADQRRTRTTAQPPYGTYGTSLLSDDPHSLYGGRPSSSASRPTARGSAGLAAGSRVTSALPSRAHVDYPQASGRDSSSRSAADTSSYSNPYRGAPYENFDRQYDTGAHTTSHTRHVDGHRSSTSTGASRGAGGGVLGAVIDGISQLPAAQKHPREGEQVRASVELPLNVQCRGGCGFFGSDGPQFGLCSSCFKKLKATAARVGNHLRP